MDEAMKNDFLNVIAKQKETIARLEAELQRLRESGGETSKVVPDEISDLAKKFQEHQDRLLTAIKNVLETLPPLPKNWDGKDAFEDAVSALVDETAELDLDLDLDLSEL